MTSRLILNWLWKTATNHLHFGIGTSLFSPFQQQHPRYYAWFFNNCFRTFQEKKSFYKNKQLHQLQSTPDQAEEIPTVGTMSQIYSPNKSINKQ